MGLTIRPATDADLAVVVSLAYAEEAAWYGEAESSRAEIADFVAFHGGAAAGEVAEDGGTIRGFVLVSHDGEGLLFLDPAVPDPPYAPLVARLLERRAARIEANALDTRRTAWLEANGWAHRRSSFDLARPGTEPVEAPRWPAGVTLRPYEPGADERAVHALVYVDAAYGSVPGHSTRPLETWRQMFGAGSRGWIAAREGRPVGWVIGRVADDGTGWVPQLAVARSEQRAGLGRALLLQTCGDLLVAGARSLGLSVQAANDRALGLYRSVGFEVDKEWRVYEPVACS